MPHDGCTSTAPVNLAPQVYPQNNIIVKSLDNITKPPCRAEAHQSGWAQHHLGRAGIPRSPPLLRFGPANAHLSRHKPVLQRLCTLLGDGIPGVPPGRAGRCTAALGPSWSCGRSLTFPAAHCSNEIEGHLSMQPTSNAGGCRACPGVWNRQAGSTRRPSLSHHPQRPLARS